MKLKKIIQQVAVIALTAGFAASAFAGDEKEVKITMDKVPAAVQDAVKKYATESEIKGIEESDVDGTKVIEEADPDDEIPQSYLLRYAPGVSTNIDCLFWWSYLGVGEDNTTRLTTMTFNFTKDEICILRFRPYNDKFRAAKIKVNWAINVEYLGIKHIYEPANELDWY